MPHWRTLMSTDYVSSADLWDDNLNSFREVTLTIERVQGGEIVGENGRKDRKPFVWFVGSKTGKPLALNATNGTTVARLAGSEDYKRWPGTRVTLFVIRTKSKKGDLVHAIRIKDPTEERSNSGPAPGRNAAPQPPTTEASSAPIDDAEAEAIREYEAEQAGSDVKS